MNNDPRKHHYIPVFYLSQWTRGGFLRAMRKVYGGKITSEHKAPDGTGWRKDLYKIEGVPADAAQHMEKTFMHMVDGHAADALRILKSGSTDPWPVKERDGWVRFIMSLLHRNPEAVEGINLHFRHVWEEGMAAHQGQYEANRGQNDPATFEEYYRKAKPYAAAVLASNFMQTIMNSEVIGNAIARMNWARIHLHRSRYDLLTSDRPLDIPFPLQDKEAYVLLPIGPKELFVASNDTGYQESLRHTDHSDLVKRINIKTISQAREFVWGVDDAALGLVKKHMSKLPDRVIISDKAREQSLKEVRGEVAIEASAGK